MVSIKAIGAGAIAAAKGFLTPVESFKKGYDEYIKNNTIPEPEESLMTQNELGSEMQSNETLQENSETLKANLLNSLDRQDTIAEMYGRNSPEYKAEVMKFNAIDNKLSEVQNEQMDRETSGSVTVVNQDNSQNNNTSNSSTEQTPGLAATENDYTAKALSAFASGRYAGGF